MAVDEEMDDSVYYRLFKCGNCGNTRMVNIIEEIALFASCDHDGQHEGNEIEWLDLEKDEMYRIERNITCFYLFMSLKRYGIITFGSSKNIEYDVIVLSFLDFMLNVEVYKWEEKDSYLLINLDHPSKERHRKDIKEEGMIIHDFERIPPRLEIESLTRLGICPCCDGIMKIKADEYIIQSLRENAKKLDREYDKEYLNEIILIRKLFIGYEIITRAKHYNRCFLNHDKNVYDTLVFISDFIQIRVFEGVIDNDRELFEVVTDEVYEKGTNDFPLCDGFKELDFKKEKLKKISRQKSIKHSLERLYS